MDVFVEFLTDNYIWILVVSLIVIFALIGYLVDTGDAKKKSKIKPIYNSNNENEKKVHPSVEAYTNEDFDEPLLK